MKVLLTVADWVDKMAEMSVVMTAGK